MPDPGACHDLSGLASEDWQAPGVGHGERWNGEPSGRVGDLVDRVTLAVALRHGGVHDVVLDLEVPVVECDAELLGDGGDARAVQCAVARRALRREADDRAASAVGVLVGD